MDALLDFIDVGIKNAPMTRETVRLAIRIAPTIDAITVVRCSECKIRKSEECPMPRGNDDDFCSCGQPAE